MPRILVVDDNPDLIAILTGRFRANGFEVVTASNGDEAFEVAKESRPDVIVMDVMMPEVNGYQACSMIKSHADLSHIPIALLTCKDSDADRFWASEVQADLYLTKPLEPAKVVEAVLELLAGT